MKYFFMLLTALFIFTGCDDSSNSPKTDGDETTIQNDEDTDTINVPDETQDIDSQDEDIDDEKTDADADSSECSNNETKTGTCGFNGNGSQSYLCTEGKWEISSECNDPDECTNDETKTDSCGLNGNGTGEYKCLSGKWELQGECSDPDECVNNSTKNESCGLNNNGEKLYTCVSGAWTSDNVCNDPDECVNGNTKAELGTYSECIAGKWNILRISSLLGTSSNEEGNAVTVDSEGNIYITGQTKGTLESGIINAGDYDVFVAKYSSIGTIEWIRQFGSAQRDYAVSVITDANNVYLVGHTSGIIDNDTFNGGPDIFIAKLTKNGTKEWVKQYGSSGTESAGSAAMDNSGNIYIAGHTSGTLAGETLKGLNDSILIKVEAQTGDFKWGRQWGSDNYDYSKAVAVKYNPQDDKTYVYAGGYGVGKIGETEIGVYDAYIRQFDSDGVTYWTTQWGTAGSDYVFSIIIDNNQNIYAAGRTTGAFAGYTNPNAKTQGIISKLSGNGTLLWTHQFGHENYDTYLSGIAKDSTDNIYMTGYAGGTITYTKAADFTSNYIIKLSNDGSRLWTKTWGPESSWSYAYGITLDSNEDIIITGSTYIGFDALETVGSYDILVTKIINE